MVIALSTTKLLFFMVLESSKSNPGATRPGLHAFFGSSLLKGIYGPSTFWSPAWVARNHSQPRSYFGGSGSKTILMNSFVFGEKLKANGNSFSMNTFSDSSAKMVE